ncbi:MAG TPA: DNA-3-methyladenine glycosylase [Candidatus Sulfotelmatobacter sp.]|nr:DNA-3-methyladenine glycosylase [Candidatus Sulfotelmatobacter sp.]
MGETEGRELTGAGTQATAKAAIRRLRRSDLPIGTVELARYLIEKIVVRDLPSLRMAGRIVETEAYPPRDPAAHHYRGPTPRNQSMYLSRGHAYIYFSYGNHFMLNVSAELPGVGGGVLIRALEPLEGIAEMERRRGTNRLYDLMRGPGRLAQALHIDRSVNGVDLCEPGPLWLGEVTSPRAPNAEGLDLERRIRMGVSRRIGIAKAAHRLLRFYERGNRFVSGTLRLRT